MGVRPDLYQWIYDTTATMPKQPDPWRAQIRTLQLRRRSLESQLLQPRPMIAASRVERFLPRGQSRRSSPAYYLSRWRQGRSKLTYVRKEELAAVRQPCQAYREFQQALRGWREVTQELEALWKRLLESASG
jgi:hypothetical protein